MRRRDYLASMGLLAWTGATAGCVDSPEDDQPRVEATPPPPPDRLRSTLTTDRPITVEVEPATPAGPTATIRFHVRNEGDRAFRMQRHGWRLFKHVDGAWRHLAPKAVPAVYAAVTAPPDGRYTYERELDNTDLGYDMFDEDRTGGPDGIRMGPGRYRFAVSGTFVDPGRATAARPTSEDGRETTVGADFDVEGDSLSLPLTDRMTVSDRADGVATVVPKTGPTDPDDPEVATLVATRTDRRHMPPVPTAADGESRAAGPRHLFVEELLTPSSGTAQSIRNALAAFESDTREVRLSTPNHAIPPFLPGRKTEAYVYFRGTVYRLYRANWSWADA